MATYRYTSNLILQTLQQNFDDRKITIDQINYWIQVVANRLRFQRLNKKNLETSVYLAIFEGVLVEVNGQKKYITLPEEVIDIEEDKGIEYISYETQDECENHLQVQFDRTTPSAVRALLNIAIRRPSPSMPLFYRAGNKLYLVGIECVDVKTVEIGLHTAVNPSNICDIDSEIPVDQSQEEILIARVLTLCRFGLVIDQERKNDGSDTSGQQQNKTALTSQQLQEQEQSQQ